MVGLARSVGGVVGLAAYLMWGHFAVDCSHSSDAGRAEDPTENTERSSRTE